MKPLATYNVTVRGYKNLPARMIEVVRRLRLSPKVERAATSHLCENAAAAWL